MSNHPARNHRSLTEVKLDKLAKYKRDQADSRKPSGSARRRSKAIMRRSWVCLLTHRPRGFEEPGCDYCAMFSRSIALANSGGSEVFTGKTGRAG